MTPQIDVLFVRRNFTGLMSRTVRAIPSRQLLTQSCTYYSYNAAANALQTTPITNNTINSHCNISMQHKINSHQIKSSLSYITSNIIGTMRQWQYKGVNKSKYSSQQRELMTLGRNILHILSGGNISDYVSSMLYDLELIKIKPIAKVIDLIDNACNGPNNNMQQWKLCQLIAHIDYSVLRKYGVQFGRGVHQYAQQKVNENEGKIIINPETKKVGQKALSEEVKEDIYNFALELSEFRSEKPLKRLSAKMGRTICARSLPMSKAAFWNKWSRGSRYNVCQSRVSIFLRSLKLFKKSDKRTDVCDTCKGGKFGRSIINAVINRINRNELNMNIPLLTENMTQSEVDIIYELMKESELLSNVQRNKTLIKLQDYKTWTIHRDHVNTWKIDLKHLIANLQKNQCIGFSDFKQKIKIGERKEEESWIFRKFKLRNDLGIIFKFIDHTYIFDVITNITNQTSLLVKCIFRYVMDNHLLYTHFIRNKITDMHVCLDCGPHFRTYSALHYFNSELPKNPKYETVMKFNTHFFPPQHGKSVVDGHFGNVSSWCHNYICTSDQGIKSTNDIINAIQNGVNNRGNPYDNITYIPINFDINGPLSESEYMAPLKQINPMDTALSIDQLKAFYHYTYDRRTQGDDLNTEREIIMDDQTTQQLLLPSLSTNKTKNIGAVRLESKYNWSDNIAIPRLHSEKKIKALKPVVAKEFIEELPRYNELRRQKKQRDKIIDEFRGQIEINDNDINMHNE